MQFIPPCIYILCIIEIKNQVFKNTLGVLAFLPGEGDLVLVNCLINDWHPRKFFTGSQESSFGPKPFQCTRYSTLPFLVLLPRIRSTYKINMWFVEYNYKHIQWTCWFLAFRVICCTQLFEVMLLLTTGVKIISVRLPEIYSCSIPCF